MSIKPIRPVVIPINNKMVPIIKAPLSLSLSLSLQILNWKQAPDVIYMVAAVFVSDLALVIALFSM